MAWRDPAGVRELAGSVPSRLGPSDAGLAAGLLGVRLGSVYLLNTLGDSTGQAIAVSEPLADDCAQTPRGCPPRHLERRRNLAYAYRAAGRTAEVLPLLERTLADRERVRGAEHPATLASRNNLAVACRDARRMAEVIPLLERTLADSERVLGVDHPTTHVVRNNLADLTHSATGRDAT